MENRSVDARGPATAAPTGIILGDCLEVMPTLDAESIDAIVTDPPYGLGFMGKDWDHGAPGVHFWAEMLRLAKPSAYLLAFGGTRTVHRLACAIEDAGWIIRDMLVWGYASGFPKSKASLKPAWEPIVMARKPGPLRELAIDACRIATDDPLALHGRAATDNGWDPRWSNAQTPGQTEGQAHGRWPANIVLSDPIFDGGWDGVVGGGETTTHPGKVRGGAVGIYGSEIERTAWDEGPGDTGTYSRFFLIPKSSRSDREPVLGGLAIERDMNGSPVRNARCVKCGRVKFAAAESRCQCAEPEWTASSTGRANHHPTVKPTELMRHLVRLVMPPGGIVLDPFLGSGTTALAAEMEGFRWVGIEREAEYVEIAEARLNGVQRGMGLDVPAPITTWKDYPTATRYPVKGPSQSSWFTGSTRDGAEDEE